jgi:hypothetical protein
LLNVVTLRKLESKNTHRLIIFVKAGRYKRCVCIYIYIYIYKSQICIINLVNKQQAIKGLKKIMRYNKNKQDKI